MNDSHRQSIASDIELPVEITPEFLDVLRHSGVSEAMLFGSFADETAGPDSDLDLFVVFDRPVTFFEKQDVAERLSRAAGRSVDLLTRIHPVFVPYIEPTFVRLPL